MPVLSRIVFECSEDSVCVVHGMPPPIAAAIPEARTLIYHRRLLPALIRVVCEGRVYAVVVRDIEGCSYRYDAFELTADCDVLALDRRDYRIEDAFRARIAALRNSGADGAALAELIAEYLREHELGFYNDMIMNARHPRAESSHLRLVVDND